MIILDAQLSPGIAGWMGRTFQVDVTCVRDLGLRDADDRAAYDEGRRRNAIDMTKDADFVDLSERLGPPPQVIWLTCGNTSNAALRRLLAETLPHALDLLRAGNALVEIRQP
jgi:predicted nuclease of predicted toxin-antitoxin system